MSLLNSNSHWGSISKTLHWLIALLILAAIILGLTADALPLSPAKLNAYIYHKSIGLTVLFLALARLAWKLLTRQPAAPSGLTVRNRQLAALGHWFLYGLMLALPLSGWLVNSAANIPFKWMHWLAVPDLPGINSNWQDPATLVHKLLIVTLAITVIGHAGMAIIHHYRHNSNVLSRMWPTGSSLSWIFSFLLIMAATMLIYFDLNRVSKQPIKLASTTNSSQQEKVASIDHTDQQWHVVDGKGKLGFIGRYDGVDFNGEFRQFSARLLFDPEQPERGYFNVIVDTASVTTYSADWDASLPEQDWFSTTAYPKASYITHSIRQLEDGYIADGELTIKGITQPVALYFQWQPSTGTVQFTAKATVNRTDFSIGSGMWADDPTIGFKVNILVDLLLTEHQSSKPQAPSL